MDFYKQFHIIVCGLDSIEGISAVLFFCGGGGVEVLPMYKVNCDNNNLDSWFGRRMRNES